MPVRSPRQAVAALLRRPDVRAARLAALESGVGVDVVGGAVRDAFLGRSGGDLDLSAPARSARSFAERLAVRLGTRVVAVGTAPRRILKLAAGRHEVDVWERAGTVEEDLLRRDFGVNALRLSLPEATLQGPPGALEDLEKGRLRPPRPGVLLEDPVRVLRAARLEATLPGFRLVRSTAVECRLAARRLGSVPPERSFQELTRLLGAAPRAAAAALQRLESWGALAGILPGTTTATRRAGIRLVARMSGTHPAVARALLLAPSGGTAAEESLRALRAPSRELRMTSRLLALPRRRRRGPPSRAEVARLLRASAPFCEEAVLFLGAAGDVGTRELSVRAAALAGSSARLRQVLSPPRPVASGDVARILGVAPGPQLGRALLALDEALASGEVRGARAAEAFVLRWAARGLR